MNSPIQKLLEKLLNEHTKIKNKFTKDFIYKQFLPYSKKYVSEWAESHLYGPPRVLLLESFNAVKFPIKFDTKYPAIYSDTWTIINDPALRERIELELMFGYEPRDIHTRISPVIKPRKLSVRGIKQFAFYFWNLKNEKGEPQPANLFIYLESNKQLSMLFRHIIKYFKDKNGREKYAYYYGIGHPVQPDIDNLNRAINLSIMAQKESYEANDIDSIQIYSKILLNNSNSLKNLNSGVDLEIPDFSKIYKVVENSNGKESK